MSDPVQKADHIAFFKSLLHGMRRLLPRMAKRMTSGTRAPERLRTDEKGAKGPRTRGLEVLDIGHGGDKLSSLPAPVLMPPQYVPGRCACARLCSCNVRCGTRSVARRRAPLRPLASGVTNQVRRAAFEY
jgi:hypothetical protein